MDLELVTMTDDDNSEVGDLRLTDGQITLTDTLRKSVAQHLWIRLRFFLGEWFLDRREGIPYLTKILVKNPNIPEITSIYRRVIVGTPGVSALNRFEIAFDSSSRKLTISSFEALLADGSILTAEDFGAFLVET